MLLLYFLVTVYHRYHCCNYLSIHTHEQKKKKKIPYKEKVGTFSTKY
jgi:hypothetical protein